MPHIKAEMINCGKPGCNSCPHGAYYYGYVRINGKLHKIYLGKKYGMGMMKKFENKIKELKEEVIKDIYEK